jgi:hypothetical protein
VVPQLPTAQQQRQGIVSYLNPDGTTYEEFRDIIEQRPTSRFAGLSATLKNEATAIA